MGQNQNYNSSYKIITNQKKIALIRRFSIIVLSALSPSVFYFFAGNLYLPQIKPKYSETRAQYSKTNSQMQVISNSSDSQDIPVRLKIPKIKVNAAIEYVGITPDGEMDVPANIANVGWFDLGPRPGGIGSAVLAGHLDGKHNQAGVFANLDKLRVGDKLFIDNNTGASLTFVVKKSLKYDPGYANEVFSRSDGAHLNLITCDGIWNETTKSYSKRLVVFADKTQ